MMRLTKANSWKEPIGTCTRLACKIYLQHC